MPKSYIISHSNSNGTVINASGCILNVSDLRANSTRNVTVIINCIACHQSSTHIVPIYSASSNLSEDIEIYTISLAIDEHNINYSCNLSSDSIINSGLGTPPN